MDVSYINPFITATITTFKTMINLDVSPGKPSIKQEPFPAYDISGIIGLSGGAQGSIAISFPKPLALKIVSAMLGMDIRYIGAEVTDGIGEIANIIAGNAKQHLRGFSLSISLPNVVVGKDHILTGKKGVPVLVVPFQSEKGEFCMEVSLRTE
jgi:chemotaxis protein CheX